MTEKTRQQIEAMKKQTIGVEVEMYNIDRKTASKVASKVLTGVQSNAYYVGEGYLETWGVRDSQDRLWKFSRDASIEADTDSEKCELVTPILTYDDIETLQEVVRALRHEGAKSDSNHKCGVHVHIGAKGHDAKTLRNLVNLMASHEDLIVKALDVDKRRLGKWCKVVNPDFLKNLNKKKPKTMPALADIWYADNGGEYNRTTRYNNSRYHMLNLHATFTKGTIEFRMFQFSKPEGDRRNGIHAGQLKAFIQFCLAISERAKTVRNASSEKVQMENPKFAMRTWLIAMGLVGDEFETVRNVFTSRLDGNNAFRFGRRPTATADRHNANAVSDSDDAVVVANDGFVVAHGEDEMVEMSFASIPVDEWTA